ncbi:hypothetical protein EsH8_VIII_000024 [Colletotrichum jinshuiense]
MDRSYKSPSWLPGAGRFSADPNHPYKHNNVEEMFQALGFPHDAPRILDEDAAANLTKEATTELELAWRDVGGLKNTVNVDSIISLLKKQPALDSVELGAIVDEAWSEVSRLSMYQQHFGRHDDLPPFRSNDLWAYFIWMERKFMGEQGDDEKENTENLRRIYMLPFLNKQDLSNPRLLGCLILNRTTNHPREFARADWEGCQVGRASRICFPWFCDAWFMGFPSEDQSLLTANSSARCQSHHNYAVVFQNPNVEDTQSPLFTNLQMTGLLFGWGEGVMVLLVQTVTLRFVHAVTNKIVKRMGQTLAHDISIGQLCLSEKVTSNLSGAWETIGRNFLSFDVENSGLVEYGQFFPPSANLSTWDDQFTNIFQRRLELAKTHLRKLWHDPFYFQACILEQYHQHYGHVLERHQDPRDQASTISAAVASFRGRSHRLPHIESPDIDAKKSLVNDLIRRVIRWAIYLVEMWQCLVTKLAALREVAQTHGVVLDPRDGRPLLPGQVRDAWVDLGFHARWFASQHAKNLNYHCGVVASERTRRYFIRRSTWQDLMTPHQLGDEWALPKSFYSSVAGATQSIFIDPVNSKTPEFEKSLWMLLQPILFITCENELGHIGLPKMIQWMRTDQRERHLPLRIQSMTADDYESIFLNGLLIQKMEAIQPISDDMTDTEKRDIFYEGSPVGAFFYESECFPFEDHVGAETLRRVQWLLGVNYSPHSQLAQSRPAKLAQQWLKSFWTEVSRWLTLSPIEDEPDAADVGGSDWYKKDMGGDMEMNKVNKYNKSRKRARQKYKVSKPSTTQQDHRPPALLRHLDRLRNDHIFMHANEFAVDRICGDITTLAPEGHQEPPTEYQPPFGSRNLPVLPERNKEATMALFKNQTQGNYDSWYKKADKEANGERPPEKLKKDDWRTMEIIFGSRRGEVTWKDVISLVTGLGFAWDGSKSGSRELMEWTRASLFPKPPKTQITVHAPHAMNDKLWDDIRASLRDSFDESFGVNEDTIRKYYHCQRDA